MTNSHPLFNAVNQFCYLSEAIESDPEKHLSNLIPNLYPSSSLKNNSDLDSFFDVLGMESDKNPAKKVEANDFEQKFQQFATYLGTDNTETALFIAMFSCELSHERSIAMDDIADFLKISAVKSLSLRDSIYKMIDKGLIVRKGNGRRGINYQVAPGIGTAIENDEPVACQPKLEMDAYRFCNQVSDYIENRHDEEIPTKVLFLYVKDLENANAKLPIVQALRNFTDDIEVRTFFYEICDDFIHAPNRHSGLRLTINDIYDNQRTILTVARLFMNKKHPLLEGNFLEIVDGSAFQDSGIQLTENGKKIFLGDDYEIFSHKSGSTKELTAPEDIREKQLFFDEKLTSQLDFLQKSIQGEQLAKLQQRLEANAQSKGIAALFYGAPGTGKTESVLQLAKATGRSVFHVDISACRTMWYGESEKLVKGIFRRYRNMCKHEPLQPILLFNEADALFSKRRDVTSGNCAQTENTIQNIILEELESLDGILIATTNLISNLDSAFARRFLFKIQFNNPTIEAKKAIWLSKMEWLTDNDAENLARNFDLSGGEIDNVARKSSFEEVLNGNRPTLDKITEWCQDEKISNDKDTKIGF